MSSGEVVSRFAPSPTGQLHIGGARTALFAWLWAHSAALRGGTGRFLLRIEDTDADRSTSEYERSILSSLQWLGLHPEEKPVRQSERGELYEAAQQQLLAEGKAYWCDCSSQRLEVLREESRRTGSRRVYDGHCRDRGLQTGLDCVLRIRAPGGPGQGGAQLQSLVARDEAWQDEVLGEQSMQLHFEQLDDFVLRRSAQAGQGAGFTYHLCCVVDDHEMGITHVVRGGDHTASVPRQWLLYRYLGWDIPRWAHLPLVLGEDGARLSKRRGNQAITQLRKEGYLPAAVANFLTRLGWSCGDRELFYSLQELAETFAAGRIGRSPATCDLGRLAHINGEHMQKLGAEQVLKQMASWQEYLDDAQTAGTVRQGLDEAQRDRVPLDAGDVALTELCLQRTDSLAGLARSLQQLRTAPQTYFTKGAKLSATEAFDDAERRVLQDVHSQLAQIAAADWNEESTGAVLREIAEELGGFKRLGMPMRLALTGTVQAPGVAELAAALGPEETLRRLSAASN